MTRRAHLAALAALVVATPTLAAAQSERYRKPAVDADAAEEARSSFWEEVVRPGANRYDKLVAEAIDVLRMMRAGDPMRPRDRLREAVALRADRADGWGYLGVANERLHDYAACADAYGRAHALDPEWRPVELVSPGDMSALARQAASRPVALTWAICLARSGDVAQATHELEALVARGERGAELFINLGQVLMASGRINDAITAFERAVDEQRSGDPLARWLLAVAYDRARRTGDATLVAEQVAEVDVGATRAAGSSVPLVPPADAYYLLALGATARTDQPRPEYAVVYLRKYLEAAPEHAPWRARAHEQLDAIGPIDLAGRASLTGAGDLEAIRAALRGANASLSRCMAALPTALIEVRITQVGPAGRAPPPTPPRRPPARGAPRRAAEVRVERQPPDAESPGVHAHLVIAAESAAPDAVLDRALDCVEKVGQGVVLPRPPTDTYSTVRVPVVANADR